MKARKTVLWNGKRQTLPALGPREGGSAFDHANALLNKISNDGCDKDGNKTKRNPSATKSRRESNPRSRFATQNNRKNTAGAGSNSLNAKTTKNVDAPNSRLATKPEGLHEDSILRTFLLRKPDESTSTSTSASGPTFIKPTAKSKQNLSNSGYSKGCGIHQHIEECGTTQKENEPTLAANQPTTKHKTSSLAASTNASQPTTTAQVVSDDVGNHRPTEKSMTPPRNKVHKEFKSNLYLSSNSSSRCPSHQKKFSLQIDEKESPLIKPKVKKYPIAPTLGNRQPSPSSLTSTASEERREVPSTISGPTKKTIPSRLPDEGKHGTLIVPDKQTVPAKPDKTQTSKSSHGTYIIDGTLHESTIDKEDSLVGRKVRKYYCSGLKWYGGHVQGFDSDLGLYHVVYDHGDVDCLDRGDLLHYLEDDRWDCSSKEPQVSTDESSVEREDFDTWPGEWDWPSPTNLLSN